MRSPFFVFLFALPTLALTACSQARDDANDGTAAAFAHQRRSQIVTPKDTTASTSASPEAASGGFVPAHDVDAVDQPESHRVVGHLTSGKSYPLLKRGGKGKNWCKVHLAETDGWVACSASGAAGPTEPKPSGSAPAGAGEGGFDYYVLTLSWSPAFCETQAGTRSPEQCGEGRHYAFVVHGLWPQNEHGWPESCAAGDGPSQELVTKMLDIMPSEHLIHHEWDTHGTCSGLSADDYFTKLRAAFQSIHIPRDYLAPKEAFTTDLEHISSAFTEANAGLAREQMAVECKGELDEVRICLDKDLKPRRCSSDVRDACKGPVKVPPLR